MSQSFEVFTFMNTHLNKRTAVLYLSACEIATSLWLCGTVSLPVSGRLSLRARDFARFGVWHAVESQTP
jgi:hypothetical protein